MAKAAVKTRGKFADEKYLGSEPTLSRNSTCAEESRAYSWYNYFYTSDDAKGFVISYLKSINADKKLIQKVAKVNPHQLHTIGWICRLTETGSDLPVGVLEKAMDKIADLTSKIAEDDDEGESDEEDEPRVTISVVDRVNAKASDLIGEIEETIDGFYKGEVIQFNARSFFNDRAIKAQVAKRIADHFKPQYSEIFDAIAGKDKELADAYGCWKKPVLKGILQFIKNILEQCETTEQVAVATRKPRKKKEKPASALVAKLQYKEKDDEFNLTSVTPKDIIHASQVWVFNCKYRNLSVYNAMAASGLTVRGTTIAGFDEKTSITKKLRKPEAVLKPLLEGGKIYLRKVMESIRCKEQRATGRVNEDCIILRIVR